MESKPQTGSEYTPGGTSESTQYSSTGTASQRARQKASDILEKGTGVVNQATETLNDTVQQAVTYGKQAVNYGRENPGTAALIAFGAGIGIGILIGSSFNSRGRTNRIISPIMGALTDIASEIFR